MVKGRREGKSTGRAHSGRKSISKSKIKDMKMVKIRGQDKDGVEQYVHSDKERPYNPPVGLVTPETDKEMPKTKYAYDPHLDPQLQYAGKAEHTSFEVDTVSLHVHERIDPMTIIEQVMKKDDGPVQMSLFHYFEKPEQNPPLREAIQFYKHKQNWSNRLIAGDSLLVMNSLLQKEGMAGKVQMIYIDPPYGIKYGSNFQPFINKRNVKDGKDEDLTAEPETVRAFRDIWELGIHSYLTYLRDRLLLARELLAESGSIFVQIGDENVHLVRCLLDEVLGKENFIAIVSFATSTGSTTTYVPRVSDYLLWYGKDRKLTKYHQLYGDQDEAFSPVGSDERGEYELSSLTSQEPSETRNAPVIFQGKEFVPSGGRHWSFDPENFNRLVLAERVVQVSDRQIRWKKYKDERVRGKITNRWDDTQFGAFAGDKVYVVQTHRKVLERCILMTTDPGDLVFDPTCGSGTTAFAAEKWGRRWITCDTSRVAIALAKQRLMTAVYDYYELSHPEEGVSSGFKYKTIPHVTLKSIANNPDIHKGMSREEIDAAIVRHAQLETLYDQPLVDRNKKRVSGPFTLEAVPSQRVMSFNETESLSQEADTSVARSGETVRMNDWIDELVVTGIRGKHGQKIEFARIEPLAGTRYLHAEGETKESDPKRIVISFGPDYAPLEQRQIELAIGEAQKLVPKPRMIVFASFQFDPEAAKDIDEMQWAGVTLLKVQMNTDLLTADLKKKRSSNESFWLIGQPDIELNRKGQKYVVEVNGFDYYNPTTGEIESGDVSKIAMWMLDTDYDGRSLYPRQVFFPLAGSNEGWGKLAKNLKAELEEEALDELFKGNASLLFSLGKNKRVAVKIIDDRGIESLKIVEVKE